MRVLPLVFVLAGCADAHPTTTTTVSTNASPPGPPPPSLVWKGAIHKLGTYSVYARAIDQEDSELEVDLSITGPDVRKLVRDDVKAAIAIGEKLTWCDASNITVVDIQGAPEPATSANALLRCKLSVSGAAGLVLEVKGAREKLAINMQPS